MPGLSGFSYRSAAMQLQNIGIKVDTIYKSSFARDAVLEVIYNGNPLTAGTKLRMGDRVTLVLGSGVGTEKFSVPTLTGLTFCEAKSLIESHGLGIGSIIIPPGTKITDTCNAYIFMQNPVKYDDEKKLQYIRTGQTIDVWLQIDKPGPDSLVVPLQPLQQQ
jgi:beta-lactam-binding protein with PASTA domain